MVAAATTYDSYLGASSHQALLANAAGGSNGLCKACLLIREVGWHLVQVGERERYVLRHCPVLANDAKDCPASKGVFIMSEGNQGNVTTFQLLQTRQTPPVLSQLNQASIDPGGGAPRGTACSTGNSSHSFLKLILGRSGHPVAVHRC